MTEPQSSTDAFAEIGQAMSKAIEAYTEAGKAFLAAIGATRDLTRGDFVLAPDPIEEQVKPAIEEPTEFGSIVHASDSEGRTFNAVRVYERAKKPWSSGAGWYGWWELTVHEVLRVGIGEDRDVAPEETSDYMHGVHDTISAVRRNLQVLRDEAITAERQDAYDKAIKAMEAL